MARGACHCSKQCLHIGGAKPPELPCHRAAAMTLPNYCCTVYRCERAEGWQHDDARAVQSGQAAGQHESCLIRRWFSSHYGVRPHTATLGVHPALSICFRPAAAGPAHTQILQGAVTCTSAGTPPYSPSLSSFCVISRSQVVERMLWHCLLPLLSLSIHLRQVHAGARFADLGVTWRFVYHWVYDDSVFLCWAAVPSLALSCRRIASIARLEGLRGPGMCPAAAGMQLSECSSANADLIIRYISTSQES